MEEADLRLAETKKESYEFDRDIMKGTDKSNHGKVVAEKIVRYFEDRLRSRVSFGWILFYLIFLFIKSVNNQWRKKIV